MRKTPKIELDDRPLAFHLCGTRVRAVKPVARRGRRLPSALVIPPGYYTVNGQTYEARREGLYRFLRPAVRNAQRLVYRRDLFALLSGISWLASHGSVHDRLTPEAWQRLALRRKIIVTCGNTSRFGQAILKKLGWRSRVVNASSLRGRNSYDCGHSLLEVDTGRGWLLVDLDLKTLFRRGARRLNLLEFIDAAADDDFILEPLAAATGTAIGGFTERGYDYDLYMETCFATGAQIRQWYRRIMMVPIVYEGGYGWYTTRKPEERHRAEQLYPDRPWHYLSREQFKTRYYGRRYAPRARAGTERFRRRVRRG